VRVLRESDVFNATPEFGKLIFETTATRFIEMALEFRAIPIRERVDHHKKEDMLKQI